MTLRLSTLVSAAVVIAGSAATFPLRAGDAPADCEAPKVVLFDAPDAFQGPGTALCYLACPGTYAYNNNVFGAVTGYYFDAAFAAHGFVRAPGGTITEFDAPGAGAVANQFQGTFPGSINARGAIAGYVQTSANLFHAFVRHPSGRIELFDAPGAGTAAFQGTVAMTLNDRGEVAGYLADANNTFHGFLRARDGTIAVFEAPGAGTGPGQGTIVAGPSGNALSDLGAVTGWFYDDDNVAHGWKRAANGAIQVIDAPDAGTAAYQGTYTSALNIAGEISGGISDSNEVHHGFVRSASGLITGYDAPQAGTTPGGFAGTSPVGINDLGVVTGYVTDDTNLTHGFVRRADGHIKDFDIASAGTASGQGTTPYAINRTGQIVGLFTDANNVQHGFVRSPDRCW
jgi:probable HAF family extracellular repeat protein